MSFVTTAPEMISTAATDVGRIGAAVNAAHAAAAVSTNRVVAAAADEVSVAIAALFGEHARAHQVLSAQAAAFHEQFARALAAASNSYVSAEAANAERLLGGVNNSVWPSAAAYSGASVTWLDVATATVTNATSLTQFVLSDPVPILYQFITNQIGYLGTLGAAVRGLAIATVDELGLLPATLRTTLDFLATGDVVDGIGTLWGYASTFSENVAAASIGTLLPALSIPSQVVAHLGNLLSVNTLGELGSLLSNVGYYPLNATIAASATTAQDVLTAVHSGDFLTALGELVNSPATITNAFLNGFPDPAWEKLTGTDPAIALLTNPTTGPNFGSVYNLLLAREVVAGALGA